MSPTLVLSSHVSSDSVALRQAALELDWSVERLTDIEQIPLLKQQTPLDWLTHVPHHYLNREIISTRLDDARLLKQAMFIKPAGEKAFPARIYASGQDLPFSNDLQEITPVLIIEPVTWEIEFRCFVLERQVITLSIYKRDGQLARDNTGNWNTSESELGQAQAFSQSALEDQTIAVPPAFVLDVGRISNIGWAVIETNPAWASGIYSCDPARILSVLRRACLTREELTQADRQWII